MEFFIAGAVVLAVALVSGCVVCLRNSARLRQKEAAAAVLSERLSRQQSLCGEVTKYVGNLRTADPPVGDAFRKGSSAMKQLRWHDAIQHFQSVMHEATDSQLVALHCLIGVCCYVPGRLKDALESFKRSLQSAKKAGDPAGLAAAVNNIKQVWAIQGNVEGVVECQLGPQRGIVTAGAEGGDGSVRDTDSRPEAMQFVHERVCSLSEEMGWRECKADALVSIGQDQEEKGELNEALTSYGKALKIFQEIGDRRNECALHLRIGLVWLACGKPGIALNWYEAGLKTAEQTGDRLGAAHCCEAIGEAYLKTAGASEPNAKPDRRTMRAVECLLRALNVLKRFGTRAEAEKARTCLHMACTVITPSQLARLCTRSGFTKQETLEVEQELTRTREPETSLPDRVEAPRHRAFIG